jgi:hypothetical protein
MKNIQGINILIIFTIILFSCASAAKTPATGLYEPNDLAVLASRESINNESRMIAYSVSLGLSVKDPENTRKILIDQVRKNNGFVVRESENYLTTRIPTENMDSYTNSAKGLGKVEDERKDGIDITDQYRDNHIRLESLRNMRDRYSVLLEKANSMNDILSIEKELERINTEIEILEGRI